MENSFLVIVRYFVIVAVIGVLVFFSPGDLAAFHVILALLFIINAHLRYFVLRRQNLNLCLILIIDCIIGASIVASYNALLLPVFSLIVLDSLFLIENKVKFFPAFIALGTFISLGLQLDWEVQFALYAAMTISVLILLYTLSLKNKQSVIEELYHKLRESEDELIKTNEDLELYVESIKELTALQERNRISREIHDSIGHSLSTIIVQLGAVEKIAEKNGQKAATMAKNLRMFTKSGLEEVRTALRELKPKDVDNLKTLLLIESLTTNFSKLTGIKVNFRFSKSKWDLDESISLVIYRAVQEFLSNSARHGKPKEIKIFLHFDSDIVILTMEDDGVGAEKITQGMGLGGLTERVHELGGQIKIRSALCKGFSLRISIEHGLEIKHHGEGSKWEQSI